MIEKISNNVINPEAGNNEQETVQDIIDNIQNVNEVAQSVQTEKLAQVEQSTSEETANQPEETLGELISQLDQLDQLGQEIKGGEKEGFLKKFSDYFNRDQKRAENEINKIAKKEGRDLVKIKNEIKNHEDKYAANVILYRDIVKDPERLSSLEDQKATDDKALSDEKTKYEDALEARKVDLLDHYGDRLTSIDEALTGYNEIYQKISAKRFEVATSIWKAERALKNLSKDKQATPTLKMLKQGFAENLPELKKQQLEIDRRYKKLRQQISQLQTDRFNTKRLIDKVENLGKTSQEIADDIRAKRAEANRIREERERLKQEAEANVKQEADKKEAEVKVKKDNTNKDETQVETKAGDDEADNEIEQEDGVDIKKLDEYLKEAKLKLSNWTSLINRSNRYSIYNGLYNFVRDDKTRKINIKKDEINGLKIREIMVDFLMNDNPFNNKESVTKAVNKKLDKIREFTDSSSPKMKKVVKEVKEEEKEESEKQKIKTVLK